MNETSEINHSCCGVFPCLMYLLRCHLVSCTHFQYRKAGNLKKMNHTFFTFSPLLLMNDREILFDYAYPI